MGKKLTTEEFIERSIEIHGNKYDYSHVIYEGFNKKVHIVCPVHGDFYQLASSHLHGHGCKECARLLQGPGVEDLTDRNFGRLTVIKRVEDRVLPSGQHRRMWLCECKCGNQVVVCAAHLKNHTIQSCGCLKRERASESNFKDLSGKRFGNMYVIKRVDDYVSSSGHKRTRYLCRCELCGREKEVTGECLSSGKTVSCGNSGCRNSWNKIDMVGRQVGWLRVLYEYKNDSRLSPHWVCKCRCGRKTIVSTGNLRNEISRSCGCKNRSHLEDDVFLYLENSGYIEWFENIDDMPDFGNFFVSQKSFDGLIGLNGGRLRFDFAVYINSMLMYLIECQGRQHYKSIEYFGGDKAYNQQFSNDNLKRAYADKNGFMLIELSYNMKKYEDVEAFLSEYF